MSLLWATIKLDVRLQARSKLYAIGVVVALLFGVAARFFFDPANAPTVLACFFLLGTGGTTYFFCAAMVLLEKSQGTLRALRTTPLTSGVYIGSKMITLVSFALLESLIVFAIVYQGSSAQIQLLPMFAGLLILSVLQVFLGLALVAPHDSITAFIFPTALIAGVAMQLPVFYALQVGPASLWYLAPTQGPFLLMLASAKPLQSWQLGYALLTSAAALGLSYLWCRRRFSRFIRLQEAR